MSVGNLSASRLRTARSCLRLHHLEWNLGYQPVERDEALRFGSLFHRALEAWWLNEGETRLVAALAAIRDEKDSDAFEQAKAEVLITGYHERWKDEPFQVVGVEARFEVELRNPDTKQPSR